MLISHIFRVRSAVNENLRRGATLPQVLAVHDYRKPRVLPHSQRESSYLPTPIHKGYLSTYKAVPHGRLFFRTTAKSHLGLPTHNRLFERVGVEPTRDKAHTKHFLSFTSILYHKSGNLSSIFHNFFNFFKKFLG